MRAVEAITTLIHHPREAVQRRAERILNGGLSHEANRFALTQETILVVGNLVQYPDSTENKNLLGTVFPLLLESFLSPHRDDLLSVSSNVGSNDIIASILAVLLVETDNILRNPIDIRSTKLAREISEIARRSDVEPLLEKLSSVPDSEDADQIISSQRLKRIFANAQAINTPKK